tara:strand:- start:11932 stop:13086 length:1155 start_codon:yes stop_codon:yes gene_type:complete
VKLIREKKIINLCNSKIGFTGNIGFRTSHIINELNSNKNYINYSISRDILNKNKRSFTYGLFKNIPSLLNYIRVNFFKNFNHKYYDILLFEFVVLFYLRFIKIKDFDIIHLWEISPKIIKFLLKRECKIVLDVPIAPHNYRNKIATQFSSKYSNSFDKKTINAEKFCYDSADVVIAPSKFVRNELLEYGINPNKIKIIPFGVKVDNYKKNFNYLSNSISFCIAGVLTYRKGIKYLLEAWESGLFKNDKLHLCGKIPPEIKKEIDSMNHNYNIIMPGFVDTYEYFKKCDVYVFPSLMEGSSKSIYEAMNRSMPIICTNESGSIILDNEEGFIIEKMNTQLLVDKMLFFRNNIDQISKMGLKSKQKISRFSWRLYSKKVIDVYNNL